MCQLSQRYIQDRFLPDKAIDLFDEAGSKLNLTSNYTIMNKIEMRLKEIAKEKEAVLKMNSMKRPLHFAMKKQTLRSL